jgi:hypothetical protein
LARLELGDLFEFPLSYRDRKLQWEAFRAILLKGYAYKRDFQEFLSHPLERLARARLYKEGSAQWFDDYRQTEDSLAGLQIDWQHKAARYPGPLYRRATAIDRGSGRQGPSRGYRTRNGLLPLLVRPYSRSLHRLGNKDYLPSVTQGPDSSTGLSAQAEQRSPLHGVKEQLRAFQFVKEMLVQYHDIWF